MTNPYEPGGPYNFKATPLPPPKPEKVSGRVRKVLLFGSTLVAGMILGVAASGMGNSEKPAPARSGAPAVASSQTPAAPKATVIVLKDARVLGDAYDRNKVAADKTYKGKRVQLVATMTNVNDDTLTLGDITTKQFSLTQISCHLSDASQAEKVENGKKYRIEGTVSGQNLGVIGFEDCIVK